MIVAKKHLGEGPRDEDTAMKSLRLTPITMEPEFTFKWALPLEAKFYKRTVTR